LFLLLKRLKTFVFTFGGWRFLLLLLNVEGFCCFFWILKVFIHTFGCWRFSLLLLLFDVNGYCFYSWMFKVFTFGFRCWKFLFLLLDIEGFYFFFYNVTGLNFHYVLIHQHQNYVYKVSFFQKYLKL
jgi:hypothetical protein